MSTDRLATFTGVVTEIRPAQSFSEYFESQTIVVEIPGKYPQVLPIDFVNQHIALLESVSIGDEVRIQAAVSGQRGRKNPEQIFVKLMGEKLVRTGQTAEVATPTAKQEEGLPF